MVAEMEIILQEHNAQMPAREVLVALAEKFSSSPERVGKIMVQMKQVWNWFQNRRYALRAKAAKTPGKLNISPVTHNDPNTVRNVIQPPQAPQPVTIPSAVLNAGRTVPDNSQMEFEAKSARDGAWYDVATFMSHRSLENGDPDVLVRFSGFGPEEDEWINVRKHVRQRSLPCEASECVAVLPGDLILCFQEGKEQALYFDAHVLDAQRRRHDIRGCRCRFLVRYDHDQSEEIVPLRKVCRRPETDYRLQQLHAMNSSGSLSQHKTGADLQIGNTLKVYPTPTQPTQRQDKAEEQEEQAADGQAKVTPRPNSKVAASTETKALQPKDNEIINTAGVVETSFPPPLPNVAVTTTAATTAGIEGASIAPLADVAVTTTTTAAATTAGIEGASIASMADVAVTTTTTAAATTAAIEGASIASMADVAVTIEGASIAPLADVAVTTTTAATTAGIEGAATATTTAAITAGDEGNSAAPLPDVAVSPTAAPETVTSDPAPNVAQA
ncbi:protein SAWADEE HOMEODOMAIN HOMOLOG 2 isoform X2 [Diospyros lotus]|uniref:protein SAWADEE HOMEODOMAIN HOMOLOG 2 isoform X2 n=1 Tax=Diospyros lotus TaxID=55363 RepID=UPI002254BD93|nr:protein SAWADEE HOMEODOMAIN HOMOLOG 2 isoform X2 [Diospyros lotus]